MNEDRSERSQENRFWCLSNFEFWHIEKWKNNLDYFGDFFSKNISQKIANSKCFFSTFNSKQQWQVFAVFKKRKIRFHLPQRSWCKRRRAQWTRGTSPRPSSPALSRSTTPSCSDAAHPYQQGGIAIDLTSSTNLTDSSLLFISHNLWVLKYKFVIVTIVKLVFKHTKIKQNAKQGQRQIDSNFPYQRKRSDGTSLYCHLKRKLWVWVMVKSWVNLLTWLLIGRFFLYSQSEASLPLDPTLDNDCNS